VKAVGFSLPDRDSDTECNRPRLLLMAESNPGNAPGLTC